MARVLAFAISDDYVFFDLLLGLEAVRGVFGQEVLLLVGVGDGGFIAELRGNQVVEVEVVAWQGLILVG